MKEVEGSANAIFNQLHAAFDQANIHRSAVTIHTGDVK